MNTSRKCVQLFASLAAFLSSVPTSAQNLARDSSPVGPGSGSELHSTDPTDDVPAPAALFGSPPPGTSATTTELTKLESKSFSHFGGVNSQLLVSGLDPYVWDVDLTTFVTYLDCRGLSMNLVSPQGTRVRIAFNTGGMLNNLYYGREWDDDALLPITDTVFVNNVSTPPLVPKDALSAFVGENPNGVWKLEVADNVDSNGTVDFWTLKLTTLNKAPAPLVKTFNHPTPVVIPDPGTTTTSIVVDTPGTCLCDLSVQTFLAHHFNRDMQVKLKSPAGTEVVVTTNNGDSYANVFNGTIWHDNEPPVTDVTYADNQVWSRLAPEGAFGAFLGENPNGTWVLTLTDVQAPDTGRLSSWSMTVTTCAAPVYESFCFGDGSGTQCPCGNNSPLGAGRGCTNGTGVGARLSATGAAQVSASTAELNTEDTPFLSYVLYWQSRFSPNMGMGARFDDGLLCAQTPVLMLGSRFTDGARKTQFPGAMSLAQLGGVPAAGGTRIYQAWYRNSGNVCGTGSNLTNGLKITWVP